MVYNPAAILRTNCPPMSCNKTRQQDSRLCICTPKRRSLSSASWTVIPLLHRSAPKDYSRRLLVPSRHITTILPHTNILFSRLPKIVYFCLSTSIFNFLIFRRRPAPSRQFAISSHLRSPSSTSATNFYRHAIIHPRSRLSPSHCRGHANRQWRLLF